MKILFFIPAHENMDVLKNCIDNINQYIEHPTIIIHANSYWTDFDCSQLSNYSNVYVLPDRFTFVKYTNMLPIIYYAFNWAIAYGLEFDYFSIYHSNCMFIRKGLESYIGDSEISFFDYPGYNHPTAIKCMQNSNLLQYIPKEKIYTNQAEGNFYRKDIFQRILNTLIVNFPKLLFHLETGEESVLATLSNICSTSDKRKYPYLLMFYCKNRDITKADVDILMESNNDVLHFYNFPVKSDDIFAIKPVHRNMNDPIRQYINEKTKL